MGNPSLAFRRTTFYPNYFDPPFFLLQSRAQRRDLLSSSWGLPGANLWGFLPFPSPAQAR